MVIRVLDPRFESQEPVSKADEKVLSMQAHSLFLLVTFTS